MNIHYPLLLDGGLSNQLEKQGCDLNHKLWSARLLELDPESIIKAHLSYLNAGAGCITTSSYQATIPGFKEAGYDLSTAELLMKKTVELSAEAVDRFISSGSCKVKPLIAASIGPYGAYLADGSEYRGNYGISKNDLRDFHITRINLLNSSEADLFACETIPDMKEAVVLGEILTGIDKPAWISFSCCDESHLNDGTPIKECTELFADHPNIFAIGVNCTNPKYISGLLDILNLYAGEKKIVIYPNSGEAYHADSKTWSGFTDLKFLELMAGEWLDKGADLIGGCCRMGPRHIQAIGRAVYQNQKK